MAAGLYAMNILRGEKDVLPYITVGSISAASRAETLMQRFTRFHLINPEHYILTEPPSLIIFFVRFDDAVVCDEI